MQKGRILFIAQHRPNRSPSQRFRFEQYLEILRDQGFDYDFSYLIEASDDKVLYSKGKLRRKANILVKSFRKRQRDLKRLSNFDIVYVQREAFMTGTTFFERHFSQSSVKFVFDFDDSIWLQNVSDANKALNFLKNPEKTSIITRLADHVVAGNDYLADYARSFNSSVSIIPTTIDTEVYVPQPKQRSSDQVIIGWSGSITTIQHFNHAVPVLKRIKEKFGDRVGFSVIGDADYIHEELEIKGKPWKADTELDDLCVLDIGIMPLPYDEWTKGKCGLKGLQYMALGIATVMSPVGVNTEIIQDGENGFLAATEDEWFEKLCRLVEDQMVRKKLGEAGRNTVEEHYSVKSNAHKYLDLFNALIKA